MNERHNDRNAQSHADFDLLAKIVVRRALEQRRVELDGKNSPAKSPSAVRSQENLVENVVGQLRGFLRRKRLAVADTAVREVVRRLETAVFPH